MVIKKLRTIRFILFMLGFGSIGAYLISQYGFLRGTHLTMLTWSFCILCLPVTGSGTFSGALVYFFTRKSVRYPYIFAWLFALLLNLFSYFFAPYTYIMSATTFLLYRIISNPWPYWFIIGASALGSVYSTLLIESTQAHYRPKHLLAKSTLFAIGLATFFYFSYFELVVFFYAQTC